MLSRQSVILAAISATVISASCCIVSGATGIAWIRWRNDDKGKALIPAEKIANNGLEMFNENDIPKHGAWKVGWKGTFEIFRGRTMKTLRVIDDQSAIVVVGEVLFLQGAYRYHDPKTFLLTNVDTSAMFDGQEKTFHVQMKHTDVFHAEKTKQIDGRTYMVVRRIGTIAR